MAADLLSTGVLWGTVAGIAAVVWAVRKYHRIRRRLLLDRQEFLCSPSAAHSLSLLQLPDGGDAAALCTQLAAALVAEGARLVYAGRTIHTLHHSAQLGEVRWDAALVVQHASREARDAAFGAAPVRAALARFAATHRVGFRRYHPAVVNVLLPVLFSVAKLAGAVFGNIGAPFKPDVPTTAAGKEWARKAQEELLNPVESGLAALGEDKARDAVLVCNLVIEHKDKQVARANMMYGLTMMRMLGEASGGIFHFGTAEHLPGTQVLKEPWEQVACVMYPGSRFFRDMLQSSFLAAVGPDKKQGDTIAVLTCPWHLDV